MVSMDEDIVGAERQQMKCVCVCVWGGGGSANQGAVGGVKKVRVVDC